jgi:hypothetical protein
MIMAGTLKTCGPCGPFYVGPLFAGLLVVSTWLLAYRVSRDGLTSALAALWMAASPTLLFNLVVPMSDLVAAALWIASFVLLTWPKPWHGAAAGIVAGAAVLVRPNLVPLLVPGVLAAELWKAGARPGRRTLAFLLTVLPAIVLVGLVNNRLYGSATLSGYGPTADLYALGRLPQNLLLYTTWLIESQGFIVLVALMPLVVRRARPAWLTPARTLPLAIYVVLLTLSYLFYLTFDAWWFLRFLLPAFPILFLLVGAALAWLTRQLPAVVGVPTLIAVVTILLARTVEFSLEKGVRGVGDGEERYSTIARFIDRTLPPNAAIIAMQHTGTIAFYSGRQTIRRDYLPRQRLRSIVDWLQANGYSPYIVLEDWEEAEFRRYFTDGQDSLSRLEVRVVAETMKPHVRVRIYDPQVPGDPNVLPLMLPVTHTGTCPDGRGQWAR